MPTVFQVLSDQPGFGYVTFASFIPLDANAPKFFGFSEFLAGLALMVLAWTIADARYRFRVRTAPLPLQGLTFAVVAALGVLTLLTDLWRASQWLVPQGHFLTPAMWQAFLGILFLLTFLTWAWFAFIRPPIYGRLNAQRYAQALFRVILQGSPSELPVIADEFGRSARSLIRFATDRDKSPSMPARDHSEPKIRPSKVTAISDDLLRLIADKKFCRSIIESSPGAAIAIFSEIGDTKKYGVQIEIFAKNFINEAMLNKSSFLFNETKEYESGLLGRLKPLSQAMFSSYEMVEEIGTLLDPDIWDQMKWDSSQWEAYCRIVLITFKDYVNRSFWHHSFVLYRAKGYIERAAYDLYKIDGGEVNAWDDDVIKILGVVVDFIKNAVGVLDKKGLPKGLTLRVRERPAHQTFYDYLASMIFEIIFSASAVRSPVSLCWSVQYVSVWDGLFVGDGLDNAAGKVVKFKLRRLIFDEIARMNSFPNFKGAKILGYCLNVLGLTTRANDRDKGREVLQKVVLSWTKKNYAWLYSYNARIGEACLVDGITYDAEHRILVKTYPAEGLRREPARIEFNLDPPSLPLPEGV